MSTFLPGVTQELVRAAFDRAGGNEIANGKFASSESSAALAANGFGWFIDRPTTLPAFPSIDDLDWPATHVDLEREMRFPWSGGRHPWLDAAVETPKYLIGIESKRHEPFRDRKIAKLSQAYDRDVWGNGMAPWTTMRDTLRAAPATFHHLDAAQLVKHAFGIVTEARRSGKMPILVYLYAEPTDRPPSKEALAKHRIEIEDFSSAVNGAVVRFVACRWTEWLDRFVGDAAAHAARIRDRFHP